MGRAATGVRGIRLTGDDEVIAMLVETEGRDMLLVSENGLGKRTSAEEFTCHNRGGKGMRCYKISEKTGDLMGAKMVSMENDIMLITTEGIVIRTGIEGISLLGRNASGVKIMNLGSEDIKVASMTEVAKSEEEPEVDEDSDEVISTESNVEAPAEEPSAEN